jgi:hypothetical protein
LSRLLVYVVFILLVGAIGFVVSVPPELRPDFQEGRRLNIFLTALQSNPKSIFSVELTNGQSLLKYRLNESADREQTTVIPIEWKGQLVQQMIDKQIPFTVKDTDYTWVIAAALALGGLGYFRLVLLPRWAQRTCPACAERVHCSAKICRYCRAELLPLSLEFGQTEDDDSDEEDLEEEFDEPLAQDADDAAEHDVVSAPQADVDDAQPKLSEEPASMQSR